MKTSIYILELKGGFYYVGASRNPHIRIADHFKGKGSSFTKKYPPEQIRSLEREVSVFLEDARTLELMHEFGINNVRGGSYSNDVLNSDQIEDVHNKIGWATGKCSLCSSTEHLMNQCTVSRSAPVVKVDPISIMNARMLILNSDNNIMSFKNTSFVGVDFTEFSDEDMIIRNTDISGSDFSRCNMSNVVFYKCVLTGVKFSRSVPAKRCEECVR